VIHWAQPLCSRQQTVLFAPTLDDAIQADHPVRLVDEVLRSLDFSAWEAEYERAEGQPPIHPRVVAGATVYALSLGIRSSRRIEDALANRLDLIWLCEGRVIDHSTLAKFRTKFADPIRRLFRQIGTVAIEMGLANLNQVALDGTTKRSNNARYCTARRENLEQKLAALDQAVQQMMDQWQAQDQQEQELFGESSPTKLPRKLRDLSQRQQRLREAMEKLKQTEARQAGRKDRGSKGPAVPSTDPDSSVIKSKSGGFAPNYTVVLASEGQNGFIIDAQVQGSDDEPGSVMPAMQRIEQNFGEKPAELLADANFNTGENLQKLNQQGTVPWMASRQPPKPDNPALRADPTQPVPEALHEKLPVNPSHKALDKSAFVYDAQRDCYHCPMGKTLPLHAIHHLQRDGIQRTYQASTDDCRNCPLARRCLVGASSERRIRRDEYEPLREEMARRMQSADGQKKYKRRSFLAETPFAVMNTTFNFRQFLLRGLAKAGTELLWICSAMNISKLVRLLAQHRLHASA